MPSTGARTSDACIPCGAGRFNNAVGQSQCVPCAAGTFTEDDEAESCTPCPLGGYCEANTAVPTRCAAGSFGNESGLSSQEGCHDCPAGSACSQGATAPTPCAAGSVSNLTNAKVCNACAAGSFQGGEGASGASEADLRAGAEDPEFLGSVLDFLLMDEAWVLAFCADTGLDTSAPMAARAALPGGAQIHWT